MDNNTKVSQHWANTLIMTVGLSTGFIPAEHFLCEPEKYIIICMYVKYQTHVSSFDNDSWLLLCVFLCVCKPHKLNIGRPKKCRLCSLIWVSVLLLIKPSL